MKPTNAMGALDLGLNPQRGFTHAARSMTMAAARLTTTDIPTNDHEGFPITEDDRLQSEASEDSAGTSRSQRYDPQRRRQVALNE
jgi:hypothetical protein